MVAPGNRQVRTGLSSVSNEDAKRVLAEHDRLLKKLAKHDPEKFQIARIAAIEAYANYDPSKGASLKHWIGRTVKWRLSHEDRPNRSPTDLLEVPLDEAGDLTNGKNPEERLLEMEAQMWLRTAIDSLEGPRKKIVVAAQLEGQTMAKIAATLGVSTSVVHRAASQAFEELRAKARLSGLRTKQASK